MNKQIHPHHLIWLFTSCLFALSACRSDGGRVPESELLKVLERKSGLIAYVGADGNIYTIDQAGNNQIALTEDAVFPGSREQIRYYQFLAWAPDSQKVGFVGVSAVEGSYEQLSVSVAAPDGSSFNQLYATQTDLPYYLFWSPDSEQLSFLSVDTTVNEMILQLVPADGGDVRLLDTGQPYYWDWAPDSKELLVHFSGLAGSRLAFLPVDQESEHRILNFPPTFFQSPAWSPTGEWFLLGYENPGGDHVLALANPLGNLEKELTTFEGRIAFAWSPDGSKVAFLTNPDTFQIGYYGPLNIIDLDQYGNEVMSLEESAIAFFWSPDSQKIAYFVPTLSDQEGPESEGSQPKLLQTLMVYNFDTEESKRLSTYQPSEEFITLLPYFDQYHRSTTIWSPNSQYLVLSGLNTSGASSIWVVPASGERAPRFLAEGLVAFWSWK